ncbi:hypothetical protein DFJ43DRAFT_1138105 [Lentinula guzmanii]|uniref:Uncharacterized protein n=1 Tax=Lentinula guzmanii TaxID=2804957 RepID=A0AA38JEF2_9AGAR|nr:hypothetical protein DFJ43DRAFT_1138105 [Lentinula guzmanii]
MLVFPVMRFASAYLGLIGLLSVARAMPMNQQPSLVSRASHTYIYTDVKFLEKPPPSMANPPSTGADQTLSAVDSVSTDAKDILEGFLSRHADQDHVYNIKFKNDYPFPQLGPIIYYSANRRFLIDHQFPDVSEVYGWVLSRKDDQGKFHGYQSSQSQRLHSPSETFRDAYSTYVGNIPSLDNSPSDTQRTASETPDIYSTASYSFAEHKARREFFDGNQSSGPIFQPQSSSTLPASTFRSRYNRGLAQNKDIQANGITFREQTPAYNSEDDEELDIDQLLSSSPVQLKKRRASSKPAVNPSARKKSTKIVLMIPHHDKMNERKTYDDRDVDYDTVLEDIYEAIGCKEAKVKPAISYKIEGVPAKTGAISLMSSEDWEGLCDDVLEKQEAKSKVFKINIIVAAEVPFTTPMPLL